MTEGRCIFAECGVNRKTYVQWHEASRGMPKGVERRERLGEESAKKEERSVYLLSPSILLSARAAARRA